MPNKKRPTCRIGKYSLPLCQIIFRDMGTYKPRIADKILADKLESAGGVLIQGPKWCGKTTTAEQHAQSVLYMSDIENMEMAQVGVKNLLQGATPRLVDEWQVAPQLWDAARHEIDHRHEEGQFIFTGSAVPADSSKIVHTGTGRFSRMNMRTMSLFESGDSNGGISLEQLFDNAGEDIFAQTDIDINRLAYLTCRGGWPSSIKMTERNSLTQAYDYVDAVISSDISRVDGVNRDPAKASRILRSLARNQGCPLSISSIRDDIKGNETSTISDDTIASYINALKEIFVVDDVRAWNPNLRSRTAIRTSDTRYFVDPSIATAALGIGPKALLKDLSTFGLILETLCIRDLRVYASVMNGEVYHYRDKSGLECDAVVHLRDGRYGLVEIKLGGENAIEYGASTLKNLCAKIDTDKMSAPAFAMILVGVGKYAYRRLDGILVVPVGTLRE